MKCIIDTILQTSMQNSVPLHPLAPDRHLGIAEQGITKTEWSEILNNGHVGFNFNKRGSGKMGPMNQPYPDISEEFSLMLYQPSYKTNGANVKENVSRGAYYTYNHMRDHIVYNICDIEVPNRDMRIISRTIFGEPSYDNNTGDKIQLQTPWMLNDMISIGLLDENGISIKDEPTPVIKKLAIKELVTIPTAISSKLKKMCRICRIFAQPIDELIKEIKDYNGVIDGVIDDITGKQAEYPAFAMPKIYILRELTPHRNIPVINNIVSKIQRMDQNEPDIDISGTTITELEEYINQNKQESFKIDYSQITNISNQGDRAIPAEMYGEFGNRIFSVTQEAIRNYIIYVVDQCKLPYDEMTMSLALSKLIFIEQGESLKKGTLINPTEICEKLKTSLSNIESM